MNISNSQLSERTLVISTPETEKLGMCFLSDKLKFEITDAIPNVQQIKLSQFLINNTNIFQNSYYANDAKIFIAKLQSEGQLCISENYTVRSLNNYELLITLKTPDGYYELECEQFSPGKAFINNRIVSGFNNRTCSLLNLRVSTDLLYRCVGLPLRPIIIPPTIQIYSIEVKGHYHIPIGKRDPNDPKDSFWSFSPDMKTQNISLNYDYENKCIYTIYNRTYKTNSGRRSSDGWQEQYVTYYAKGMKFFSTRSDMKTFIFLINGKLLNHQILIKDLRNNLNSEMTGHIDIDFINEVSYSELHKILGLVVNGYCSFEYE